MVDEYRGNLNSSFTPPDNGLLPGDFAAQGFAVRTCGPAGWRVPTAGEIVGVSYGGDAANLTVERAGGAGNNPAQAPAGALKGMVICAAFEGGKTMWPDAVDSAFYELDSRDLRQAIISPSVTDRNDDANQDGDVRFLSSGAPRWVMCVKSTNRCGRVAGVGGGFAGKRRSDGGGFRWLGPHSGDKTPSFTVTATLSSTAISGDDLFVGTVYSWKHKDDPTILSGVRPRVSLVGSIASTLGYEALIEDADGDTGTKIRIRTGSNIPAGEARRESVTLDASHALGITATIVVMMSIEARAPTSSKSEYTPAAATGGALAARLDDNTPVQPDSQVDYGQNLNIQATPEVGYYVHSWGGACVGAPTGRADAAGVPQTCVVLNVQTPTVTVAVFFGRDECLATSPPCDAANGTCTDAEHRTDGTAVCACNNGFGSVDGGQTCIPSLEDAAVAADARTVTTFVSPTYTGSVAFFAAELAGATLRTPAASPTGFEFETDADFVAPDGFAVSLLSALGSGAALTGSFAVRASLFGYLEGTTPLRVEVSALAAPEQAALTASHLDANYDGLGHALSAPEGFAFADAILTVLGEEHGSRFAIDAGNNLQPADASDARRRPKVGKYFITVGMTHGGFLGTLALSVSVRIQTSLLANNVLANRERVQDAVAGHFGTAGDAGHLLTVGSGYTLAALRMSAGVTVDVKPEGYEVRLLSALGNSTVAAAFEGNVRCAESLDCNPSQLSMTVTVYFSPLASPVNVVTLDWQDYDEDFLPGVIRLNAPDNQEFRDTSYTLVAASLDGVPHANLKSSRFFQDSSGNVKILGGGEFPALGVHELLFDATRSSNDDLNRGFLGVLTLTMTIHVVRGPLIRNWRLQGGDVQREAVTVARGYAGLVHEDELVTEHELAGLRTAGAASAGFSTEVAGLTARVFLTGQTPAPALGTLTFEVYNTNPTSAANYAPSTRGQSVIVSVAEVSAPAQATLTASHLDANYDGLGHTLSAPEGFAFADATLTVLGEHGLRFTIGTDNKLQPANASRSGAASGGWEIRHYGGDDARGLLGDAGAAGFGSDTNVAVGGQCAGGAGACSGRGCGPLRVAGRRGAYADIEFGPHAGGADIGRGVVGDGVGGRGVRGSAVERAGEFDGDGVAGRGC